jgi:hypothetical protein
MSFEINSLLVLSEKMYGKQFSGLLEVQYEGGIPKLVSLESNLSSKKGETNGDEGEVDLQAVSKYLLDIKFWGKVVVVMRKGLIKDVKCTPQIKLSLQSKHIDELLELSNNKAFRIAT